ncbi:MAG TPA: enoyl-CoA hydratase, partial [Gammaproteobacteria bacterium]|nr:enoyl-CoA hydratase [Gammaproteobacteria bacterium]
MSDRYIDYDKLLIERPADGILKITFNKPESFNSVDSQTHSQLTEIWRDIDADSTVRAVLVTGAGKAFSAGGDFDL